MSSAHGSTGSPGGSGYRVLRAGEAFWRPSNQMGVLHTDLARQLGLPELGARLWRLEPGQASTRHRHVRQTELYLVVEGRGRMRIDEEVLTLDPLSSVAVEPRTVRQISTTPTASPCGSSSARRRSPATPSR